MTEGEKALAVALEIARTHFDGHLTLLKFTTGWRVSFGTPDFSGNLDESRACISSLPSGTTLENAVLAAIRQWVTEGVP